MQRIALTTLLAVLAACTSLPPNAPPTPPVPAAASPTPPPATPAPAPPPTLPYDEAVTSAATALLKNARLPGPPRYTNSR